MWNYVQAEKHVLKLNYFLIKYYGLSVNSTNFYLLCFKLQSYIDISNIRIRRLRKFEESLFLVDPTDCVLDRLQFVLNHSQFLFQVNKFVN